jgi:hypothetical protein
MLFPSFRAHCARPIIEDKGVNKRAITMPSANNGSQAKLSNAVAQARPAWMRPRPDEPYTLDSDESYSLNPGDPLRVAADAILERAWTEIAALLQDNWQAVVRVAGVLAKRARLTQDELDRVIAHGRRGRRQIRSKKFESRSHGGGS